VVRAACPCVTRTVACWAQETIGTHHRGHIGTQILQGTFHVARPPQELSRYFSWQLRRNLDAPAQITNWIGHPSPESRTWFLRKECEEIRQRASILAKQLRALYLAGSDVEDARMQRLKPAIESVRTDAGSNGCSLDSSLIDPQMPSEEE